VLAESISRLRPLEPYPNWRFSSDWDNPDPSFTLRRKIWQHVCERKTDVPITIPWHYDTRIQLRLGTDSSLPLFIGGCVEPNEFAFLDRFLKPGMTFIDVGANDGLYTTFAARHVGPSGVVWAFEPSQREFARLQSNVALNGLQARLFPFAITDQSGTFELTVAGFGHEGQNTLGQFAYAGVEALEKYAVQTRRLDDLIASEPLARIDAIKIDIEGAELRALQGAKETLRRYRPMVLFEGVEQALQHQGGSVADLIDFWATSGYSIYFFDPQSGLPVPKQPGMASDNMIAIPNERGLPG